MSHQDLRGPHPHLCQPPGPGVFLPVQRAAAEVFCARHANADYFPSYEIGPRCRRDKTYKTDNIHVMPEAENLVMPRVIKAYCPDVPPPGAPGGPAD